MGPRHVGCIRSWVQLVQGWGTAMISIRAQGQQFWGPAPHYSTHGHKEAAGVSDSAWAQNGNSWEDALLSGFHVMEFVYLSHCP